MDCRGGAAAPLHLHCPCAAAADFRLCWSFSARRCRRACRRTSFPNIRIPIIAVTFQYAGMPPDEMSGRITAQIERYATTIVNDIEHVESQTYPGVAVIKLFFQPGVDINLAMAQVTAFGQTVAEEHAARRAAAADPQIQRGQRAHHPAGACPATGTPRRSCSTSATRSFAHRWRRLPAPRFRIRTVARPARSRSTCKPDALRAQGLTANDVNAAISNQNLIVPAGTQKIGDTEYNVKLNSSPAEARGHQQPADPHRERRRCHDLYPRCGLRARRPSAADEHRARGRPARGADDRFRRPVQPRR